MSLSLGEKLRQAREEKGFALSEVADQTRISSLYLESIENDDYKILPGGIFNKGFVKSYAKFVGINEQEALDDYARLIASTAGPEGEELKVYRPEVLTDDRSSMAPTVIAAVIILALMTGGILLLIDYLRQPSEPAANIALSNSNADVETTNTNSAAPSASAPDISATRIEFRALDQPVSLSSTTDGKTSSSVVTPGTAALFEPKESLKLSYSRSLAQVVELTINEKPIVLPSVPFPNPKRQAIEFEITKENLERIWNDGAIIAEASQAAQPAADTDVAVTEPSLSAASPSVQATSASPRATPPPKPASTPRPAVPAATAKPTAKPPVMKPTVIQVRPANGQ